MINLFLLLALLAGEDAAMTHARRSYSLHAAGKDAEAERELREAIRLDSGNPLFHSALAGLLAESHKADEAILEMEAALNGKLLEATRRQLAVRLEQMILARGAELAGESKFRSGLELSERAERRFPRSAQVLQMHGFFQAKARLNIDAVATYRRALALMPGNIEVEVGLAVAQAGAGLEAEAVRSLETGMRAHPGEPRFPQALGVLLLARPDGRDEDVQKARMLLQRALQLHPDLAEAHYQLGRIDLNAGDFASAARHLETAAQLDPGDGRAHFALATLYRRLNRSEDAQREMDVFSRSRIAANNR